MVNRFGRNAPVANPPSFLFPSLMASPLYKIASSIADLHRVLRMPDEFNNAEEQRNILRRVALYRELCQRVRRSSTMTLIFGAIMLAVWSAVIPNGRQFSIFGTIFLCLAILEFGTGLLNRFWPSAEGVLLEGAVLVAFGSWNVARELMIWQGIIQGGQVQVLFLAFGVWWIFQGLQTCRSYFQLRVLFAQRPSAEHLRWFDDLLKEIRESDPRTDALALRLPTEPYISAKLLGENAFFLYPDGDVVILGREEVYLERDATKNPEKPIGYLILAGYPMRPFPLSQANWDNYVNWKGDDGLPVARPIGS